MSDEYLRRNLIHAKAVGAGAAVALAIERARALKRPPKWLLALLAQAAVRLGPVQAELAARRDDITPPPPRGPRPNPKPACPPRSPG